MRYIAIPLLILGAALSSTQARAEQETVRLCAGRAGGGYDSVMRSIAAELTKRGALTVLVNHTGSEDILRGLESGQCDYGAAQKDIHYLLSSSDKSVVTGVTPISLLYNEAMTLVCSTASGYDELSDLQEGDSVIVGEIGSGSALTWENMVKIEQEYGNGSSWSQATPSFTPLDEAGAALSLGTDKCAFGVGSVPISWATEMEAQGNVISWVEDKDIDDLEHAGGPLYPSASIPAGAYSIKWSTHLVPALLFRSGKSKVSADVDRLVKRLAPSLGQRVSTLK